MESNISEFASTSSNGEEHVSNPLAAFAHGLVHSFENVYNGALQIAGSKDQVHVAKSADSNSSVAQGAFTAGELVGSGVQLVALGKLLPQTRSMLGSVARSGAVGAFFGGVLQPSEGTNLAVERFKNGLAMGAFMSVFEVGRVGSFAAGIVKPTLVHSLGRGSIAGGLAGASHEVMQSALEGKSLRIADLGGATAKGMVMGAGMELTSAAILRTDMKNLSGAVDRTNLERAFFDKVNLFVAPNSPRIPTLLNRIRLITGNYPKSVDVPPSYKGPNFGIGMPPHKTVIKTSPFASEAAKHAAEVGSHAAALARKS